jgi:hypothetical protein
MDILKSQHIYQPLFLLIVKSTGSPELLWIFLGPKEHIPPYDVSIVILMAGVLMMTSRVGHFDESENRFDAGSAVSINAIPLNASASHTPDHSFPRPLCGSAMALGICSIRSHRKIMIPTINDASRAVNFTNIPTPPAIKATPAK